MAVVRGAAGAVRCVEGNSAYVLVVRVEAQVAPVVVPADALTVAGRWGVEHRIREVLWWRSCKLVCGQKTGPEETETHGCR